MDKQQQREISETELTIEELDGVSGGRGVVATASGAIGDAGRIVFGLVNLGLAASGGGGGGGGAPRSTWL